MMCSCSNHRRNSLAIIVALTVAPCTAQSITPQRHTRLSLASSIESDSNVLRQSEQAPTLNRSDVHVSPSVSFDMERPIGLQSLYLVGALAYNDYARHTQLNNASTNVQGGVDWRGGFGCVLRSGGNYARQLVKIEDVATASLAQSSQTTHGVLLRLMCARGSTLRPSLGYRTERVTNSAAALRQNDATTATYDARLGIQRHSIGELAVYGQYRRTHYPHHLMLTPEFIHFYDGGLSLTRDLGGRIRGAVTLGYNQVVPEASNTPPYSGLVWTGNLTLSPGAKLHLALGLSRSTQQSTLLNISYSIDTTNQLNLDYALTHRLKLVAGALASHRRLVSAPEAPLSALGTGDRSITFSGGLHYAPPLRLLGAPVSYALDASYSKRTAENPAYNYHDVVASLSVRVGA